MRGGFGLGGVVCFAALVVGAGCSGGSSPSTPRAVGVATATPGAKTQMASVKISITVPAANPGPDARKRHYVSRSTKSLAVVVGGVTTTADITPSSNGCTTTAGATTCTFAVNAPVGVQTFTASAYDGADGAGNLLSDGSTSFDVVIDTANTLTITLKGEVAHVLLSIPSPVPACSPTAVALSVTGEDADFNTITGTYSKPITLTNSNASGVTTIAPTAFPSPAVAAGNSTSTITYTGASPGYATITASVGGTAVSAFVFSPGPTVCAEKALTTDAAEPRGITSGSDGLVYFTEFRSGDLVPHYGYVVPTNDASTVLPAGTVMEEPITLGVTTGNLQSAPNQIVTGPDKNLWVTDNFEGIDRFTPGNPLTQASYSADASGEEGNDEPVGIVSDPTGASGLWFIEEQLNDIKEISTAGVFGSHFKLPTKGAGGFGIATGPDKNFWFTESIANKIGKMTPAGTFAEYNVPTASSDPTFITKGPDGAMWFSETMANQIGRIAMDGTITEFPIPTPDAAPEGIVTALDGNLYFAEDGRSQLARITPAGAFTEFKTIATPVGPYAITVGPDGNLWFTELTGNNVGYAAY